MTYGLTSWGNTYKTTYAKIITKQNKCVRAMFFANKRENADPYYGILDLLKFENIFKLNIVEFTYKISKMNSNVPLIFQNFLKPVSHQYNTRYAAKSNFKRPMVKTNYGKHTFQYAATKIWELVPIIHSKNHTKSIYY